MSEQRALEILADFANALEAAAVNVKHQIAELSEAKEKCSWDPSKINWENVEGSSGPYQRSEDVNNPDFKAMLKDLQGHNGKLNRDGYFYWVFEKRAIVGRKWLKKKSS